MAKGSHKPKTRGSGHKEEMQARGEVLEGGVVGGVVAGDGGGVVPPDTETG